MLNKLLLIVLFFALVSCHKKPSACIDAPKDGVIKEQLKFVNCATNQGYVFWEFSDGQYSENFSPKVWFENSGDHTCTQFVYSDDGYRKDEISHNFTIWKQAIDSIVLVDCHYQILYNSGTGGLSDIAVLLGDVLSNETYENLNTNELPVKFTFPTVVFGNDFSKALIIDNSAGASADNEIQATAILKPNFEQNPFEYEISVPSESNYRKVLFYWHPEK